MFDFQKLNVYQKARQAYKRVIQFLEITKNIPLKLRDNLSRASLSVMLNIAEGAGRFTKPDKKRFYIDSRASAFETVSCLEACNDLKIISSEELNSFNNEYEEISKMLFKMINN
jgi:four helix bundle protein